MKASTAIVFGTILLALAAKNAQARKADPQLFYPGWLPGGLNAQTIPPFGIFIKAAERGNETLLLHEMEHWKQYQQMGLLKFYATYLQQLIQHGYNKMPMEQAARVACGETDYCVQNYIECVRNGQSVTVNNPNFGLL